MKELAQMAGNDKIQYSELETQVDLKTKRECSEHNVSMSRILEHSSPHFQVALYHSVQLMVTKSKPALTLFINAS